MKKTVEIFVGRMNTDSISTIAISDYDRSAHNKDYILYDKIEIEIDFNMPSESEQKTMVINSLKQRKSEILADAQVAAEQIEDKIQSLMAIEND